MAVAAMIWGAACVGKTSGGAGNKIRIAVAKIEPLGTNTAQGTFQARADRKGVVTVEIEVSGLTPGRHGTHIHAGNSCGDAGKEAGPHWDPGNSGKHGRPADPPAAHHAADMPNIEVGEDGRGRMTFRTTNFTLEDLSGKTVIVHEQLDDYTDSPANGGSGSRIGCGMIRVD